MGRLAAGRAEAEKHSRRELPQGGTGTSKVDESFDGACSEIREQEIKPAAYGVPIGIATHPPTGSAE